MYLTAAAVLFVLVFIIQCVVEFPKGAHDWIVVFVVSVIVGLLWPFAVVVAAVRMLLYLINDTDFGIREWLKKRRE